MVIIIICVSSGSSAQTWEPGMTQHSERHSSAKTTTASVLSQVNRSWSEVQVWDQVKRRKVAFNHHNVAGRNIKWIICDFVQTKDTTSAMERWKWGQSLLRPGAVGPDSFLSQANTLTYSRANRSYSNSLESNYAAMNLNWCCGWRFICVFMYFLWFYFPFPPHYF